MVLILLFIPIYLESNAHYDLSRRKFAFSVLLYKKIPLFGGYATSFPGGIALHLGKKKAYLIPYAKMNNERKRFSFFRTFHIVSCRITTETGAEYLGISALVHMILRVYFFMRGGKKENIENNTWLTDGNVMRISAGITVRFTLFLVLKNFIGFLKENYKNICRKKKEKSTI